MRRNASALAWGFVGLLLMSPPAWAAKTDKVLLFNGDLITGEVKSLNQGILTYSTDSMGKVPVEWEDVRGLQSPSYFEFDLHTGERVYGSLGADVGFDSLAITIGNRVRRVPVSEVVTIVPIRRSFWGRIDGSLSLGISYTKATTLAQITLDSHTTYTAEKNRFDLELLSINSSQKEKGQTSKVNAGLTYIRLLGERWLAALGTRAEHDDELGIDLRVSGGGGGGYYIVQTNHMQLSTTGGILENREYASGADQPKMNTEATLSLEYALFKYKTPKTNLTASLRSYASLNVKDRYRFNANIGARQELVKDFFFSLTFYEDVDTKPPSGEGRKTDYGIVSSLGWTY